MENPASDSSFPQDECKQHVGLALIESIQLQPFTYIHLPIRIVKHHRKALETTI
jgi:hypothetical protein